MHSNVADAGSLNRGRPRFGLWKVESVPDRSLGQAYQMEQNAGALIGVPAKFQSPRIFFRKNQMTCKSDKINVTAEQMIPTPPIM